MPQRHRLFWPATTTAVMLMLTVGLGVWQLQRLVWKRGLLAEIANGESSVAVALPSSPPRFQRVFVVGRFDAGIARYGVELRSLPGQRPALGSQVISALVPQSGLPILIDRGWAPLDAAAAPPTGQVRVEGYVRLPERSAWSGPRDEPANRQFYALDPGPIGVSLGLSQVAPFTLVVLGKATSIPIPATTLPRPPNDHLVYALTWFGLALTLIAVFTVYARRAQAGTGAT